MVNGQWSMVNGEWSMVNALQISPDGRNDRGMMRYFSSLVFLEEIMRCRFSSRIIIFKGLAEPFGFLPLVEMTEV